MRYGQTRERESRGHRKKKKGKGRTYALVGVKVLCEARVVLLDYETRGLLDGLRANLAHGGVGFRAWERGERRTGRRVDVWGERKAKGRAARVVSDTYW